MTLLQLEDYTVPSWGAAMLRPYMETEYS